MCYTSCIVSSSKAGPYGPLGRFRPQFFPCPGQTPGEKTSSRKHKDQKRVALVGKPLAPQALLQAPVRPLIIRGPHAEARAGHCRQSVSLLVFTLVTKATLREHLAHECFPHLNAACRCIARFHAISSDAFDGSDVLMLRFGELGSLEKAFASPSPEAEPECLEPRNSG